MNLNDLNFDSERGKRLRAFIKKQGGSFMSEKWEGTKKKGVYRNKERSLVRAEYKKYFKERPFISIQLLDGLESSSILCALGTLGLFNRNEKKTSFDFTLEDRQVFEIFICGLFEFAAYIHFYARKTIKHELDTYAITRLTPLEADTKLILPNELQEFNEHFGVDWKEVFDFKDIQNIACNLCDDDIYTLRAGMIRQWSELGEWSKNTLAGKLLALQTRLWIVIAGDELRFRKGKQGLL